MRNGAERGAIHLGDLIRALASLDCPTESEARAIAASLGFGLGHAERPRPPEEIYDRRCYPHRGQPAAAAPADRPLFAPPLPNPPPALPKDIQEAALTPLAPAPLAPDTPSWLQEDDPYFDEAPPPALVRETLFPARRSRHILAAALATHRSGREIDLRRLVGAVGRCRTIRDLPRLLEATLERGCQLLLDYNPGAVPFWEDLTALQDQVEAVVGAATTEVFGFTADPSTASRWTPTGERRPWEAEGRPVLVATDFGIQGHAGRARPHPGWDPFITACQAQASPLLVLIPWPQARWPTAIGPYPILMHWSPHTSAAMVKRVLGGRQSG